MNILIKFIVVVSIFLIPLASIIPVPGTIIWYPQLISLLGIGFILLSAGLWKFNKYISIFTAYLSLSYIFICNQHPRALLCLICAYIGCYIAMWVSKQKNTKILYDAIKVVAIIQFVYVLVQFIGLDFIFTSLSSDQHKKEIVGFAGSYNQLGAYYAIISPLLISISAWFGLVVLIPVILSKTSTALVASVVGILILLFINKKMLWLCVLSILIIICSIFWVKFDNGILNSFSERFKIWELTVNQLISGKSELQNEGKTSVIKSNPMYGNGLGSFMVISPYTQDKVVTGKHRYEHAHNDLIEALYEFGYVGLCLILLIVSSIIYSFYLVVNKTKQLVVNFVCLIAMAICSFGVYIFHAPVSYFMTMLMLGLFYAEVNNASESV